MNDNKKVSAGDHESYATYSVIAVILPLVGIILGIVFLTKDEKLDRKLGEHLVAFSVLAGIFWYTIYAVFLSGMFGPIYILP